MIKKINTLLFVVTVIISSGCAPTPMYYWGDYSRTLYHFRKDASDAAQDKHMAELEAIIKGSQEHTLRVPPGVYCELGYMYAKKGDRNRAMELFNLEKVTYPESTHFVDRLAANIKTVEGTTKKSVETDTNTTEAERGTP